MKLCSRIDHVSIAVKDYEKARAFFKDVFGAVPCLSGTEDDINYHWQGFALGDLTRLELISPSAEKSFLDNFLAEKRDGGVHHITIETPDIKKAREWLGKNDVPYFGYNEIGDLWKEIFIHPQHAFGVLIQIAEFRPDDWLADEVKLPKDGPQWMVEKTPEGCELTLAHPGGGKVNLALSKQDIKNLIADLKEAG